MVCVMARTVQVGRDCEVQRMALVLQRSLSARRLTRLHSLDFCFGQYTRIQKSLYPLVGSS